MEVSERTPIEDSLSTMQHSPGFYPLDPISSKDFGLREKHDATLSRIRAVRPHFLEGFWAPPKTRCDPIKDQGCQTQFPRRILGSAKNTMRPYQGSGLSDSISSKDFGLRQKHDATLSDQGCQTQFPARILGSAKNTMRPYQGSGLSDSISSKGFWAPPGTGHNPIEDQGWVTKTKDSMFSVSKTNPIEDSSAGSPKIAKQYVFLYASRQRQSKPTAKPKASLHCVYIYIYACVCKSTEAEQANRQTQSHSALCIPICVCMQVDRSRASQPPNPKPFCIVYSNRHKQGNPNDKHKALLSLQAEQPNRQTESHSGKLRKT